MPRKSLAAVSVLPVRLDRRPEPPEHLSPAQAELWRTITEAKSADWFTVEALPLLEAYVRAIEQHRLVSNAVDAFGDILMSPDADPLLVLANIKALNRLHAMQERQANLMQSLATKMRLTQQSRWQPSTAASKSEAKGSRPWESA